MKADHVARTISVYDQIADVYAVRMNDYTPEKERDAFVGAVPRGGTILDAGCAAGRDAAYFVSLGFQVVGVDLSEKLLSIANSRVPDAVFVRQDVRSLTFPGGSFDGIWACAVLVHLSRAEASTVITDFARMLKPGGTMCVLVKEGEGEADISEKLSSGVARHFVYFTTDEIEDMVRTAGLTVTSLYTWNSKDRYVPVRDVSWISCFARKEVV